MPKLNKRTLLQFSLGGFAMILSACATPSETGSVTAPTGNTGSKYYVARGTPFTPANKKGQKLVRIALLAPFNSQNAAIRAEADTLKAAAELAISENGDGSTILMPIDSGDLPETAEAGAKRAIQGGADFIMGPLFSSGVSAVAPYARANNAMMFSFSTDTSEAGRGLFVVSFLPEDEARRIVTYAGKHGVKKLVLLVPQSKYGEKIELAAAKAAARSGIKIIGTARYDSSQNASVNGEVAAKAAARYISGSTRDEVAILIPERGNMLRYLVKVLSTNGASMSKTRYLGTGLWNDDNVLQDSRLLGGWFVSPDNSGRSAFEDRLQKQKNKSATRLAGMGYDTAALVARLVKAGDKSAITSRSLENTDGFDGVDGRFRFDDGVIERGMSVMEVSSSGVKTLEGSPKRF